MDSTLVNAMLCLLEIYERRIDLQEAFPEVMSKDYRRLLEWACSNVQKKWEDDDFDRAHARYFFGDLFESLLSMAKNHDPTLEKWRNKKARESSVRTKESIDRTRESTHENFAKIIEYLDSARIEKESLEILKYVSSLGFHSDWSNKTSKTLDFTKLVMSVKHIFPPGGTIEVGVYAGGTSSILMYACCKDCFHISIDPYGLLKKFNEETCNFKTVRATLRKLSILAEKLAVTHTHFMLDSHVFVKSDLLFPRERYNIVHLDGDHSYKSVSDELNYFIKKINNPVVLIFDDHDEHYPGVDKAIKEKSSNLKKIFHKKYQHENYGIAGFSAFLYGGNVE